MVKKGVYTCEISGSHGGEHEDDCLLRCCAARSLLEIDRRFRSAYCLHHQGDHRPTCNMLLNIVIPPKSPKKSVSFQVSSEYFVYISCLSCELHDSPISFSL
jgi:hypothetical protein